MEVQKTRKIPVILDTDIGDDIDDTWALAMLLNSPELDLKLVVTEEGNTPSRAKIAARLLEIAGRTDVPVGIGLHTGDKAHSQAAWVADYELANYPGTVYDDGVGAMIDCIMASDEPVTVIAIGPLGNVAEALAREPRIAARARFVGMHGSVRKGYNNAPTLSAEYNVLARPAACRAVFAAPWQSVTITPVDTCGLIVLKGDLYQRVMESSRPLAKAVIENYRIWWEAVAREDPDLWRRQSSVLFDTVAVYLAFDEALVEMEELGIRVTDDGYTLIDENAKKIRCATAWKDQGRFEELLVERITA